MTGLLSDQLSHVAHQLASPPRWVFRSVEWLDLGPNALLQEGQAVAQMYEEGARLKNDSTSLGIIAGATVGGGTRINW